jgi:uncharacterized spore protein YtfJ
MTDRDVIIGVEAGIGEGVDTEGNVTYGAAGGGGAGIIAYVD